MRVEGVAVDGGTINAWVGAFSIERAGGALATVKLIQAAVITNAAGVDIAADIIAVKAETALIVADTGELQTNQGNWLTVTGHATEAKQDIIDTNVDQIEAAVITNAAGVDIAADIIAVKAETALIVADTGPLTFTDGSNLDVNIQKINDVTIVGDGSATPFNV